MTLPLSVALASLLTASGDAEPREYAGVSSVPAPRQETAADPAEAEPLDEPAPEVVVAPAPEPEPEPEPPITRRVEVGSLFGAPDGIPRIAGSAQAIGERELERAEHDDIHEVLYAVPGVYIRGEDGFGLRPNIGLRGANSDRSAKVTLLEDGLPMAPAPYASPAAYYFPLTTRMAGVEVFKGPAALRHGPNTIGGAVNLRTRDVPEFPMGHVDLAGGRFGYLKGHGYFGTTWKGFGVLVEGARVQSDGFKELDGGGDTGFGKNDSMLKLSYRTDSGRRTQHLVLFKGGFANEKSHETYLGLSDADFSATPYRRYAASANDLMTWWRTQAEATYLLSQEDGVEFELRLYRHDMDRGWRKVNRFRGGPSLSSILQNPDAGQNAVRFAILRGQEDSANLDDAIMLGLNGRRYVAQGAAAAFRWKPHWEKVDNELELGARAHADSIVRDHTEDPFLMTSGVLVPEGTDTVVTADNRGSVVAGAFHVHDVVTLFDRVSFAPGVRLEVISTRFDNRLVGTQDSRLDVAPLPGFGAHVLATKWLGVFAGVHRGFSPVAPGQPAEVRPEFSVNYELGSRLNYKFLAAEATGFFSDYSNMTGECTFSGGCSDDMLGRQFNGGRVFVYGLESRVGAEYRFNSRIGLRAGARYTFTGSQFRTSFNSSFPQFGDVVAGDELAYVPRHLLGGDGGAYGDRWQVGVSAQYTGEMRDVAGQGAIAQSERIPGFFVLGLSGEVAILRMLRLYANVRNATASQYMASRRPFGVRPGAPLTFMIGVKATILPK